jgi:myosin-5
LVFSVLFSAGKTESTKQCLKYLSTLASHPEHRGVGIEQRVLATNPILESFGNAKTARNDNSSRFGKWLEVAFAAGSVPDTITPTTGNVKSSSLHIVSAKISEYLLEKSRVTFQLSDERNYHIFYQLCSDPSLGLEKAETYRYLNQSGCITINGLDDKKELMETLKCMDQLSFTGIISLIFLLSIFRNVIYFCNRVRDGNILRMVDSESNSAAW